MDVDHCAVDVFMSLQLLNRAHVLSSFEQESGERIAKGLCHGWDVDTRDQHLDQAAENSRADL